MDRLGEITALSEMQISKIAHGLSGGDEMGYIKLIHGSIQLIMRNSPSVRYEYENTYFSGRGIEGKRPMELVDMVVLAKVVGVRFPNSKLGEKLKEDTIKMLDKRRVDLEKELGEVKGVKKFLK